MNRIRSDIVSVLLLALLALPSLAPFAAAQTLCTAPEAPSADYICANQKDPNCAYLISYYGISCYAQASYYSQGAYYSPASCSVSLSPNPKSYAGSATLSWSSSNAHSWVYINNVGYVGGSGSISVAPTSNTDYSCYAYGYGGTDGWHSADGKGKGASGFNRKAETTDAPERGGLPRSSVEAAVMVVERRGQVIAVDLGQPVRREEPLVQREAAAFAR